MISIRSSSSRRSSPMALSQIALARGARGGLFRMRIPSSANMASKLSVNSVSRSRIGNLSFFPRSARFIRTLRAAWVVHSPGIERRVCRVAVRVPRIGWRSDVYRPAGIRVRATLKILANVAHQERARPRPRRCPRLSRPRKVRAGEVIADRVF